MSFFPLDIAHDQGRIAIVIATGSKMVHYWVDTAADAATKQAQMPSVDTMLGAVGVYFSPATFTGDLGRKHGRTQDNATFIKSFWLDIDAGADKCSRTTIAYPTQEDALIAIDAFYKAAGLPRPTLVSSGEGVHVYWELNTEMDAATWLKIAKRLAALGNQHGLLIDPTRTKDPASLMRVPNTQHKLGKISQVLYRADKVDTVEFCTAVHNNAPAAPVSKPRNLDTPTEYKPTFFKHIVEKTKAGSGCQQLANVMEVRGNVPEPLWRAALSVVNTCKYEDTEEGQAAWREDIRSVSDGYPGFSMVEAEEKLEGIRGPYTCEVWESTNPGGCAGCPFKGNTGTPVSLGRSALASAWEREAVELASVVLPTREQMATQALTAHEMPVAQQPQAQAAPVFIAPHVPVEAAAETVTIDGHVCEVLARGVSGDAGVYVEGQFAFFSEANDISDARFAQTHNPKQGITRFSKEKPAGDAPPAWKAAVLCDHTVRVVGSSLGDASNTTDLAGTGGALLCATTVAIKRVMPITHKHFSAGAKADGLTAALSGIGVQVSHTNYKAIQMYISARVSARNAKGQTTTHARAMGWTPRGSFILGETEFSPDGTAQIASLGGLQPLCASLGTTGGTLEEWNTMLADMYGGTADDAGGYQFGILAGFGAPLHATGGDIGGVIHLFTPESGAGKTTLQTAVAAIYGPIVASTGTPTVMMSSKDDTVNARIHKLGILNSLPLMVDEVTTMRVEDVGNFIYSSTQGRAKDRMASDTNKLRDNSSIWGSYVVTSSNRRLSDMYSKVLSDTEGLAKRVWEIQLPHKRVTGAGNQDLYVAEPLRKGKVFGVAGAAWIAYLVENIEEIEANKKTMTTALMKAANLTRADRFFANMAASALTAGIHASSIGLHPFDMGEMYKWTVKTLMSIAKTTNKVDTTPTVINEFVMRNVSRLSKIDTKGNFMLSQVSYSGPVGVVNQATNRMALQVSALRAYANECGASQFQVERVLESLGCIQEHTALAADPDMPRVLCYVFDIRTPAAKALFSAGKTNQGEI